MYNVHGVVVGKESGLPVRGAVVELLDTGETIAGGVTHSNGARRLVSGITGPTGGFSLRFDSARDAQERKPNLLLIVWGPEATEREPMPLFVSPRVRREAASEETYYISIPEAQLEAAGIRPAGESEAETAPNAAIARRIVGKAEAEIGVAEAEEKALAVKVERTEATAKVFREEFLPALLDRLSAVDGSAPPATYVAPGQPIGTAMRTVVEDDVKTVLNHGGDRAPVKARFALTDEQREAIAAKLDDKKQISEDELLEILGPRTTHGGPIEYVAENPLAMLTRQISDRERTAAAELGVTLPPKPPTGGAEAVETSTGMGIERLAEGDIPRFLARLTDTMTSPEESVLAGLEPKATEGRVADRLAGMSFKPSPADVSAFYDFSHLQIAFRHVWQEAIDEGVLSLAESAYDQIVKAGGTPARNRHRDPFTALANIAELVYRAAASGPPAVMARPAGEMPPPRHNGRPFGGIPDGVFETMAPSTSGADASPADPLPDIINELNQRLREPYAFTTFAANRKERSVNFGCLVTYRQEWQPIAYQAGRLAKTLTLAPKEVRRYSKTIRRRSKRAEKEVKNHLQIRKDETAQTSRLEQEIIAKAHTKTNFEMSAENTAPGGAGPSSKISFGREANQQSDSVKKAFHESVVKAAQELKDEFNVEVTTEEASEYESTESGELQNPNESVAVAFLLYDLQRVYQVRERLNRITAMVLVAQEMPAPHEINESWIIAHDWILRRVLLDDSFVPALDYLCQRIVGDQVAIAEIRTNITQQRQIIGELKQQLKVVRQRLATYRSMLEQSLLVRADRASTKSGGSGLGGLLSKIPVVGDAIELHSDAMEALGDFINPDTPNVGDSRMDALKETIQRTADEERDALMRIEREVTALNTLTETYARMLADNQNQRALVLRLRIHIKQNITFYMQAIWNHRSPDERFLMLHETPVPTFKDDRKYDFGDLKPIPDAMNALAHRSVELNGVPATKVYEAEVISSFTMGPPQPLAKVADLSDLRGYFGNLMMFPLKVSNPLTDFMMEPFVLKGFNQLTDPDDIGNWTLDEFADYALRLKETLGDADFEKVKSQLQAQYQRLLQNPLRNGEMIVVPTGSLFIEALPATTSLDEQLRRLQRTMEVKLGQEQVRTAALNNLRLADRLLHGEREDPDFDKQVVIKGVTAGPTVPIDDPA